MSEKLFNVGVKAIIKRKDKVLIVHNTKGYWILPGGRIDGEETIEQTLRRELSEELPNIMSVQFGEILHVGRVQQDIKENISLLLVFYQVIAEFEGVDPVMGAEIDEYKWATKDEALAVIYDNHKEAIEAAFK